MNVFSDEEAALDSGDMWRCEHCGKTHWTTVGMAVCGCRQSYDAAEERAKALEVRYVGDGRILHGSFTVNFSCYNTEDSFRSMLSDMVTFFEDGVNEDDILNYRWEIVKRTGVVK